MRITEFAGQTHYLHSAFCLALGDKLLHAECVDVPMIMRKLSESEIDRYVESGEWEGCVGCYQFENRGGLLFDPKTSGDQSSIIGLPIRQLNFAFLKLGINLLTQPEGPWEIDS